MTRFVKRINSFSAWILIQALPFGQIPPVAWARPAPGETEHLRIEAQKESRGGLEELQQRLTEGVRKILEPATLTGLEEAQGTYTLADLSRIEADPVAAGLRSAIEKMVPAPYVEKEFDKARKLIREGLRRKQFLPDQPIALVRAPGRARIFMGHPDFMGMGSFSIDVATHQSIWMLVQLTDDGKVIADNLDPQYRLLKPFGIGDKDVLPVNAKEMTEPRPHWLEWAQAQDRSKVFKSRWEGLVKGTFAAIRTAMLDPKDLRREYFSSRGVRMLLSESDIPSGKGFSASSSIPAGIGLALNALWEGMGMQSLMMSWEDLRKLDYAAYVVNDLAGVGDITAVFEGDLGQATVLGYDPDRVLKKLVLPPNLRVFAFDSNIPRLNAPSYRAPLRNYGKHMQTLSNISVPLAILWLRMMARNDPKQLGFLEEVLTAHWPSGVIRELTEAPDAAIRNSQYADKVVAEGEPAAIGRGADRKRRRFVNQLMAQVPNELPLGQIVAALREGLPLSFYTQIDTLARELVPLGAHEDEVDTSTPAGERRLQKLRNDSVIPMRQMTLFGINEFQRGLDYIAAVERGDSRTPLRLMREAQDGERALYDPFEPYLAGALLRTDWGLNNPPEAYQRSLPGIDELVDRFQKEVGDRIGDPEGVAARGSAAMLGGLIIGAVDTTKKKKAYDAAVQWLRRRRPPHEVIQIAPSAGARVIRLPKVKLVAVKAGLEEGTYEVDGTDVRVLRPIRVRAQDRAEVVTLPNGSTIEAKSKGAVLIAPGTLIQSGVKIVAPAGQTVTLMGDGTTLFTGTVIDGQVWVGRNVKVDAQLRGRTWLDHNVTFTPGSQTVVEDSVLAQRGRKSVSVKQSTGISGSVLWGSATFQDAVVTESIMDFAVAGNHTFQSRSRLAGVSAQHVTSAGHFNYLISMFNLPLAQWRDLSDPHQREEAFLDLLALRYGELIDSREIPESTVDHSKRPLEELILSFNGQRRTVLTRASNLGAGFGTSNLKTREGDRWTKGPTFFWGGVMAGVGSYTTAPAELGPSSTLANNAGMAGQVRTPGTLVVPEAAPVGRGVKKGRMDKREGRLSGGVQENIAVRLQVMRALEILARVAAEGISRAQSPAQRAGYRKEVELLQKFHGETVADLKTYLAAVKSSAQKLQVDLEQPPDDSTDSTRAVLVEQRQALGFGADDAVSAEINELAPHTQVITESSGVVKQAAEAVAQPPRYPMGQIAQFENPDGIFELVPGSLAMNGAVIADGQRKVRQRQSLGIIFVAGKGGRFKDSVPEKSPDYGTRAAELGRVDTAGDVIKFAAPTGVSNFPALFRQLEAFAELGFRARQPFEVVLVDSAENREMFVRLMEEDRTSATPRIRWAYLNFVGARADGTGVLVNGATLQEVDPVTGKPILGTEVHHTHVPLVDQGEGWPATYAEDVVFGGVQRKKGEPVLQWNPVTGQIDLPYKPPSGEYGALMAGVNAALAANIPVAKRDVLPTYGDQVELYSDPDRLAALLGNVDRADVTGVAIPHGLVSENDPATGRPQWDPNGGVIVKTAWPDGEPATAIAERDVRDPTRAKDGIYNSLLDESELALAKATGTGYPYSAAPPVFSVSFMGDLLSAKVDVRHQRKDRQIQFGPDEKQDKQPVPVEVTELEMTQLMQLASQQGRVVQVARVPREARQALKEADDILPANDQIFRTGQEHLRRLLGDRLKGDPSYVEIAPGARGFFATEHGTLTVSGRVGIEIDRWGFWIRRYEGESPFAGSANGIPRFSQERRLLIPAYSDGLMPLDDPIEINEQTYDLLGPQSGLEESVIHLPAGATAGHLVVLTPVTVGVGVKALAVLRSAAGDPGVQVAVIVQDAAQERAVRAGLEEAGITLALPMVSLQSTGWSLPDAIDTIRQLAAAQALETFVVDSLAQFRGLAEFLRIPLVSVRSWYKWIGEITTGAAA